MSGFENSKQKTTEVPETLGTTEGSAKRNIVRKHKGGGGGLRKGKGNPIDDGSMDVDTNPLDEHDPNYDSEQESAKDYSSNAVPGTQRLGYVSENRSAILAAPMTLTSFKRKLELIFEELFQSGDIQEAQRCVLELECPQYSYELVKRAISMSLDRADKDREIISRFISESYPDILSTNMIGKGFERLFELVDELEKDVPAARECLATFLSRCVVDEVLPPSFLSDIVVCNLGGEVVDRAKRMLSREHGHAIIEKAWGPGDGRPVEELKSTVDLLMHEYLLSRDKDEANRCIRELHSDLFHHEIVKRGVIISMDKSEEDRLFMSELFEHLHAIETVSPQQFIKGFNRLYEILKDIELDIPNAPILLTAFKDRAVANGVLPVDFTPTH